MTTISPTVLADIERAKQGQVLEDDLRESVRGVAADIERAKQGLEHDLREGSARPQGATLRPAPDSESEAAANSLGAMVQRVGRSALEQIDGLIGELHSLGDLLEAEGRRVQREIAQYTRLSQASVQSTKIMAEALAQWKSAADPRGA
jgi:hypothetical protein